MTGRSFLKTIDFCLKNDAVHFEKLAKNDLFQAESSACISTVNEIKQEKTKMRV
jgi:hypothetical protein